MKQVQRTMPSHYLTERTSLPFLFFLSIYTRETEEFHRDRYSSSPWSNLIHIGILYPSAEVRVMFFHHFVCIIPCFEKILSENIKNIGQKFGDIKKVRIFATVIIAEWSSW